MDIIVMLIKEYLLEEITFELAGIFFACGLFILYFDRKALSVKKLNKDRRIIIGIGVLYVIIALSITVYVILS